MGGNTGRICALLTVDLESSPLSMALPPQVIPLSYRCSDSSRSFSCRALEAAQHGQGQLLSFLRVCEEHLAICTGSALPLDRWVTDV